MRIESGLKNDLPMLLEIFNRSRMANDSFPKQVCAMDEFMAVIEGEEILVARIAGELVGFVSIWKPDRFLHHLFVLPDHQRHRIGKALMNESVRMLGLPLSLKCIKDTDACRFYEQLSWQAQEEGLGPEGPYIFYYRGKTHNH